MARRPEEPAEDVTGALHDVSNALTVLIGWVQEARAEGATREFVDYALGVVERRARMARDLARRAITSDGDVAAAPPDVADEDIDAVVTDVLAALKVEAERARVTVTRAEAGPRVTSSARIRAPADVSHALTNLVLNAFAFAPAGTSVTVTVVPTEGAVAIEVTDAGPGVSPERVARIFEGDTTRAGGAGVGLRHARAVARGAGGDLELLASDGRAAGENQGARFRLTWPRADARVPAAPSSIARVRPLEGKRVLLLEDDADVIELLDTALEARGADVVVARTRAELYELLVREGPPFEAALIDLSPIEGDVTGALEALAKITPRVNVVLITGAVANLPRAVEEGTVRWVRKPFEVREVVAALAERGGDDDAGD